MNAKRTIFFTGGVVVVAIMALLIALIVLANKPGNTTQAQTTPVYVGNQTGVTVSGQGSVIVTPDVVQFSAGVVIQTDMVVTAQQQAAQKMDAIKKALNGQGVKDEDIKTANFDINPDYVYDQGKTPRQVGYSIRTAYSVTVRDINKAGAIIDAVAGAGANQIGSVQFGREKEVDLINQARVAAMTDAKNKASQLASAGGFTLGTVISVNEYSNTNPVEPVRKDAPVAFASDASGTALQSGQLKVTVQVTVLYGIK